jgi:phosphatidylglycerol:prolipoprotein diacylglycerol transferase
MSSYFSYLIWNPNRVVFTIPYINHPIVWYGVLFALGFLVTYFILRKVFVVEILSKISLDQTHIVDWDLLHQEMEKYPDLFSVHLKKEASRSSIVSQLEKYIKLKLLPRSFYRSQILNLSQSSDRLTDQLTVYIVCGTIVGARLGYVIFYGWPLFRENWLDVFKIWTGGLASHGACVGILTALYLYVRKLSKTKTNFSYLHLMDFLAITAGFFSFFIRLGNFVNQEIVGIPSEVPWAIFFLNPFDGNAPVPRHPVQLYEGLFYLFVAITLFTLWKKNKLQIGNGLYAATFLISLFSFRFFIEFLKEPQGVVLPVFKGLLMGQLLSIPFIFAGIGIILKYRFKDRLRYKKSQL